MGNDLFAYVGRGCLNVGGPGARSIAFLGGPQGGGVDAFQVNMADGSLRPVGSTGPEVADLNSESMCVSQDSRFVYCCNRTAALHGIPGAGGGADAFAIKHEDGSLRYLNALPSMGAMPACVRILYGSNRIGGGIDSIAVFTIDPDTGRLTRVDMTDTVGGGQREFNVEPSGKYLFACHMQTNEVIDFAPL
jgi:6-phosphogluconolactonase (cycloisomerase 2 family)